MKMTIKETTTPIHKHGIAAFRSTYLMLVGFLLGLLQTGYFFQLTFTFSSSFRTFLMITLAWLLGSALGVTWIAATRPSLHVFLAAAFGGYLACSFGVHRFAFATQLWPMYAVCIAAGGVYAGVFLARMKPHFAARRLFLWENNGYIGGVVFCTLGYLLFGRWMLYLLPALIVSMLWLMGHGEQTAQL